MVQKHRLPILIFCTALFALVVYTTNRGIHKKLPSIIATYTPENTRLLFDFDDVILTFPEGAVKKFAWDNAWTFLKNPSLTWKMKSLKKQGASGAEYVRLCQKYNAPELEKALRDFTQSKVPMPGMTERLQQLHAAGFQLDGGSNMYEEDYLFYKAKYPELFSLLTNVKVISPKPGIKTVKKPETKFFQEYQMQFPSSKKTLFFDDKYQNVQGAESVGFVGCVFKGIEQFDKDMAHLLRLKFSTPPNPSFSSKKYAA